MPTMEEQREKWKRYGIKTEKPKCCGDCKYVHITASEGFLYQCPLTRNFVDYEGIDKDCPIEELKPVELKWREVDDGRFVVTNSPLEFKILKRDNEYDLYDIAFITTQTTLEDAKKFFELRNKAIFRMMLGE